MPSTGAFRIDGIVIFEIFFPILIPMGTLRKSGPWRRRSESGPGGRVGAHDLAKDDASRAVICCEVRPMP